MKVCVVSGQVFEGGLQHQREQQGPKRVPLSHSGTAKHWRLVRVRPHNPELAQIAIQVPSISGKGRASGQNLLHHFLARERVEGVDQVYLEATSGLVVTCALPGVVPTSCFCPLRRCGAPGFVVSAGALGVGCVAGCWRGFASCRVLCVLF